jgi:hypothetical protein
MRKKCVRWAKPVLSCLIAATAVFFVRGTQTLSAQASNPGTLPRIEFSNLSYLGAFRLPAETVNGDSFSIGGRALTFNPQGNSLFVSTRAGRVAEVSIPTLGSSTDVNALPFASFVQPFFDPMEGKLSQVATDGVNLEGLMVYGNRLYGTASIYYDAQNTQSVSHFSRSLRLDEPSFQGWSKVWETGKTGFVAGAMAEIPNEWRALLGGPAATGQCCIPIVSRTSWGPAAFAFDPAQVGQASVSATPLLYYTGEHQTLGPWDGSNPVYGASMKLGGMAIIAGTRTVLYFGRNGTGVNCYGNGTADQTLVGQIAADGAHWCYDPTSSDKGSHAYPYRYQIWAYDLNDFAAVKAGQKQPWEVVPYGVWPFDLPTPESEVKLGGVGYDASTQTLYFSQMGADRDGYSYRPIVHALRVNGVSGATTDPIAAPVPPPPGPTTPPVAGSTLVRSITLAVNRNAPQVPGTAITFTAFATGGATPHEYKWLIDDGSGFKPVTTWSTLDSFTWTPGSANPLFRVGVWARSNGNARDEAEASVSTEFPIAAPVYVAVSSVSFVADKPAPQAPGTTITFTATGQGGNGPLQFKWLVHDGNSWSAVTGWSAQNTFAWTPAVANSSHRIGVWARSNGSSTDEPDATSSDDYAISIAVVNAPRLTDVMLSTDAVAPQPMGRTINITATPVGGAPGHTYRWLIHDGTQWNVVSGWTTSNQFAWTPAKADPNYRIGVWVRAGGNTSEDYEVSTSQLFPIQ